MTFTQWVEYHVGTKRKSYNTLPTNNITAEAVTVDGFTLSQTDNAGVTTTAGRSYTANGMIQTRTDGRGNTTTTVTDTAGRTLTVTDAAGNVTTMAYDSAHDLPATVTDAQGNTSCYRYDVRGYLQITCCDLNRSNHPALWLITRDPTQPIATRPLAIQKDATWYTYGWDLTKNICELYGANGYIRTTYTPYGEVTESANSVYQPIQWSSEYNDTELGLVYYNYRHYNPLDGRWLRRDRIEYNNLYIYINNIAIYSYDYIGLLSISDSANISEVDRSELGEEIGRMNPVVMPVIPHYKTGCFMRIVVPDTELKVTIELANKDIDYLAEMKALIESTNNNFIDLKYARKRTREHELEHFRDYKRVKRIYLNFLNNVYDGFTCKFEKLNKLKNALNEYINARINADAVELDMRDYLLEKKESKIAERPKVYQKLMEAEINYAKAHLEYYE